MARIELHYCRRESLDGLQSYPDISQLCELGLCLLLHGLHVHDTQYNGSSGQIRSNMMIYSVVRDARRNKKPILGEENDSQCKA